MVSSIWSSGGMYQRVTVQSNLPEQGQPFYLHAAGLVTSPTRWGGDERERPAIVNYNITVNGAIDPSAVARQIKSMIGGDSIRDGGKVVGAGIW